MVRDVCSKYIYDKCPAVAAVGQFASLTCLINVLHINNVSMRNLSLSLSLSLTPGPVEQLPDYNRTRASMYWLRF